MFSVACRSASYSLRRIASNDVRGMHSTALRLAAERSVIESSLRDGLKAAMKAKDRAAVSCLKSIIADVTYGVKSSSTPNEHASQENVVNTIRKGIDKRSLAAESYAPGAAGAHEENYASLESEIALLRSFLPTAPSTESLQKAIDNIVAGLSDDIRLSRGATGSVIKALWDKLGDARAAVNKKEVAQLVEQALKK